MPAMLHQRAKANRLASTGTDPSQARDHVWVLDKDRDKLSKKILVEIIHNEVYKFQLVSPLNSFYLALSLQR